MFDLRWILDDKVFVAPKPERAENLTAQIDDVFENNVLSASHAARIVGKADFVASTFFGNVGCVCLAPIRARQCQIGGSAKLQKDIDQSLCLPVDLLRESRPQTVGVCGSMGAPVVLYTDGEAKIGDEWFMPAAETDQQARELRAGAVVGPRSLAASSTARARCLPKSSEG